MKKLTSTFLLLLASAVMIAQNSVTGVVTNENKDGLEKVKVIVKDLNNKVLNSTSTNAKGEFAVERISEASVKLEINHNGYEKYSKTVSFSTQSKVDLTIQLTPVPLPVELITINEEKEIHYQMNGNASKKMAVMDMSMSSGAYYQPAPTGIGYVEHNTEAYDHIEDNGFKSVKKDPLSTLSIDVDRASYSNVRRFITDGQMPPADAVRVEEMINYFSYNYPTPTGNVPLEVTTTYTTCPWNNNHDLVHIGLKSKEISMEEAPMNNLVFLLDVSGSMNNPDKLPLLKKGLALLVDQMRPEDKVAIVVYAGAAGVVLEPTNGKHKDQILEALENLSAGGSTAGGAGIKLAYQLAKDNFVKNGNNRVILATDGDFNIGASSDGEMVDLIESKRNDGIFLTVLGFGSGNLKDSKMEKLADHGNGNYAYIDNILEAKKTLVNEMGGTLITVAKDVKFQLEFNPAHVKEYRLIGYENRLLNAEDFNDDKKDAGELGAGHCVTAIYEIIPAGSPENNINVDNLKYQTEHHDTPIHNGELLTVKVRYKQPQEDVSSKIELPIPANKVDFSRTNEDVRFSVAVAAYGMILRNSDHKGTGSYEMVKDLARNAKGEDREGYRAAFIQMVEMTELLDKRDS